jgi:plastocyanin
MPMINAKYYLIMMVLLAFSSFPVLAADSSEAAKAESTLSRKEGMRQEKRFIATVDADGVQRVEMVGGEYFYDPNYIIVKVNTPVELKIKKPSGFVPHNLIAKSPEAGIDFKLDLKKDHRTIKFTPTKIGKYPIYCDKSLLWFKTHRERGMEGMIEVVE